MAASVATAGAGPPAQRRASGTVGCHTCSSPHACANSHAATAPVHADLFDFTGCLCLEGAEPSRGSGVRRQRDRQSKSENKKGQSINLDLHRRSIPAGCSIMGQ